MRQFGIPPESVKAIGYHIHDEPTTFPSRPETLVKGSFYVAHDAWGPQVPDAPAQPAESGMVAREIPESGPEVPAPRPDRPGAGPWHPDLGGQDQITEALLDGARAFPGSAEEFEAAVTGSLRRAIQERDWPKDEHPLLPRIVSEDFLLDMMQEMLEHLAAELPEPRTQFRGRTFTVLVPSREWMDSRMTRSAFADLARVGGRIVDDLKHYDYSDILRLTADLLDMWWEQVERRKR